MCHLDQKKLVQTKAPALVLKMSYFCKPSDLAGCSWHVKTITQGVRSLLLMRCKYLGEMGCSSLDLLQEVAFWTGSFRSVRGSSALYTQWASTS